MKPVTKKNLYTQAQLEAFYALIEDWLFCEGLHKDQVIYRMADRFKVSPDLVRKWISTTQKRWR